MLALTLRHRKSSRGLAYSGRAHPLDAWAVPLRIRAGRKYQCKPINVLCKLPVVSMWDNLWLMHHGVERYECPGPGGDMHHEEYMPMIYTVQAILSARRPASSSLVRPMH